MFGFLNRNNVVLIKYIYIILKKHIKNDYRNGEI